MKINNKKKKATVADVATKQETPAGKPVEIKRERIDAAIADLIAAPWNPRGDISPESVADLVASIRTVGIIEPIVVMPANQTGKAIIIAGHRRVAAAKLAGLATIPADQLLGIDTAAAKRMTFIENLQRKDADPILESNLVAELVADGMSTEEIAAEIGRDQKWVLRRKNLSNLSPSWRKLVAKGRPITINSLEHIAAYPAKLQEELKDVVDDFDDDVTISWNNIKWVFHRESCQLKDATFDTSPCLTCPHNTGCQPELFDWDGDKPAKLGKCLDRKCYNAKLDQAYKAVIDEAKAKGYTIVEKEPSYLWKTSKKKTAVCNTLCVWQDYQKRPRSIWAEIPAKTTTSEKEKADRSKKVKYNKALRELKAWCAADNNLANILAARFVDESTGGLRADFVPFVVFEAFFGMGTYHLTGASTTGDAATAMLFGNYVVAKGREWCEAAAGDIIPLLDPSRNSGYYAEHHSKLVIALAGRDTMIAALGKETVDTIVSSDRLAKFVKPTIKFRWDKPAQEQAK